MSSSSSSSSSSGQMCDPAGAIVNQYCQGYDLWVDRTNGTCGTYPELFQACSPSCNPPSYGTPLGTSCSGADLYGTYADGNCGTFTQVIQINSPSCPGAATCSDGIQNQGETGVDCGGPCAPCPVVPTCWDGIQNQGETGIDCGGPCAPCPPVATCSDGIQNQGETGVDCGGPCPDCPPVATCSDGVQNQGETGVDCGGPCAACGPVCGDGTCEPSEKCGPCTADCPMPTQFSYGHCVGTSWVYYYHYTGCWALNYIQTYDGNPNLACGAGAFSGPVTVCDTVFTLTLPEAEACGGACTGSVGEAPCDCPWLGSYSHDGVGQQPGYGTPICN